MSAKRYFEETTREAISRRVDAGEPVTYLVTGGTTAKSGNYWPGRFHKQKLIERVPDSEIRTIEPR